MKNFAPKKRPHSFGERPSMHTATCNKCGNTCEVPFKPNGRKPVYCGTCFRKDEQAAPHFDHSAKFQKPAYQSTPRMGSEEVAKLLKSLDGKMDQILEALEDLSSEA